MESLPSPPAGLRPNLYQTLFHALTQILTEDSLDQLIWAELGENPELVAPGPSLAARIAALIHWAWGSPEWAPLVGALDRQFPHAPAWTHARTTLQTSGFLSYSIPAERTMLAAQRYADQQAILHSFRTPDRLHPAVLLANLGPAITLETEGPLPTRVRHLLQAASAQGQRVALLQALQRANPALAITI